MLSKARIKQIHSLEQKKYRRQEGLFVPEGHKLVGELLMAGHKPVYLCHTSQWKMPAACQVSCPADIISEAELKSASLLQHPQQVLALFPLPEWKLPENGTGMERLLLALDGVQDPGNVGTLARTLFAMGGAGLVLPKHNSAFLGPGARRSAAGALERLPLTQVVNLSRAVKDARDAGFVTCAAQKVEDSIDPLVEKLPLPALLVLGNEESGVRPGVLKHCECSLCIPFRRDFDSLNVAQAGAILISCFARSLAL